MKTSWDIRKERVEIRNRIEERSGDLVEYSIFAAIFLPILSGTLV